MFAAELHGKLPSRVRETEDLLTSHVFGLLKYADRRLFLRRFLDEIGCTVSPAQAEDAGIRFWQSFPDGTEPDVIIEAGPWYIVVEAKLRSGFGVDPSDADRHQLRREIVQGREAARKRGARFRLLTITAEAWCDPRRYRAAGLKSEDDWVWTNWQAVSAILQDVPADERGLLAEDLLTILRNRGLTPYYGFKRLGMAPTAPEGRLFLNVRTTRHPGMFRFVQRLYDEVATLIREIEGTLAEEPEQFMIGRPSGYGITTRGSTGLDPQNVNRWLTRRLAVFFVQETETDLKGGQTRTPLAPGLRILYLRFMLDGYDAFSYDGEPLEVPTLLFGVLEGPSSKREQWNKFENIMTHFEYVEPQLYDDLPKLEIDNNYVQVHGHLSRVDLFDLENTEELGLRVIEPLLTQFRA